MTTDLFSAITPESTPSTEIVDVDAIKQKFGGDVDAIAKAKAEADAHIKRIESENAGMRKELEQRLTLEQFMDEIKSKQPSSNSVTNPEQNEETREYVSKDEALQIAREAYKQERSLTQAEANRKQVADTLRKNWGTSFIDKLASKAAEVGLSREQVNAMAASAPQALLKLVDADVRQPNLPNTAPPSSQVRAPQGQDGTRNSAYYSKLRKDNPNTYWSIQTQRQMHQDATSMGDEFYSR